MTWLIVNNGVLHMQRYVTPSSINGSNPFSVRRLHYLVGAVGRIFAFIIARVFVFVGSTRSGRGICSCCSTTATCGCLCSTLWGVTVLPNLASVAA